MSILYYKLLERAGKNTSFTSGLIRRKSSDKNVYVTLYPQKQNSMIIYDPESKFKSAPLHINFDSPDFDKSLWDEIKQFTKHAGGDPKRKTTYFYHFSITSETKILEILKERGIIA